MSIAEPVLNNLRKAGLMPFRPFRVTAKVTYDGIRVAKPQTTRGNTLPDDYSVTLGGETMVDAPILDLYTDGTLWFVKSHAYIPGPGPGDFTNEWLSVDEALRDILDFFFGSPSRMEAMRSQESRRRK